MKEEINIKGHVQATLFNEVEGVKQELTFNNLVVTVGKEWIIDRIGSNTPSTASWIAVGSGTNAAVVGDNGLQTLIVGRDGTVSQPSATTHSVVTTFGAGVGTGTITEYGLYASGSALIGRVVSGSIVKASGDSLQVTYQLTIS